MKANLVTWHYLPSPLPIHSQKMLIYLKFVFKEKLFYFQYSTPEKIHQLEEENRKSAESITGYEKQISELVGFKLHIDIKFYFQITGILYIK